jgi:predicted metal-binding membrane protein
MVPMMLPSLAPMLSRYRRSVRGADGVHRHGRTALVALGYFAVWAVLGMAAYAAGAGIMAIEMRQGMAAHWLPVAAGVVILLAGGVQVSLWKARQLAACREGARCGCPSATTFLAAARHGLGLGLKCSLCCGSLMVALLATGMMDLVAMAVVTLAISAERLAPAPARIARITGVAILAIGVVTIARA